MHNSILPAASLILRSMGWALLYSLWQGAVIYICLSILFRSFRNISAQVKYHLSFASLTIFIIWFADTWMNQWQRLQTSTVYITQNSEQVGTTHTIAIPVQAEQVAQGNILNQIIPNLDAGMPYIILAYMLGLLLMICRFGFNLWQIRRLTRQGLIDVEPHLYQQVQHCQSQLGITRQVAIFLSDRINVPAMMGVVKPIILLPLATVSQLTPDQLEAVLIHELAHIKRHDYLLNILQTIIETLLFFNPFVWLMSAIIRREREHCCDDIVVANTSYALSYAKALAQLETARINTQGLEMAASGGKNQLFNRIKRIMEMKKNSVNYSQLSVALIVILVLIISIAWLTPTYAQRTKNSKPDKDSTIVKKSQWSLSETYTFTDDNGNTQTYHSYDDIPADKKKLLEGNSVKKGSKAGARIIVTKDDQKEADIDMPDIKDLQDQISGALASVDWSEIGKDIKDATKDIHFDKFEMEPVDFSFFKSFTDSVDWSKMKTDIKSALDEATKSIKDEKTRRQVREQVKAEMEKAKAQMQDAKERVRVEVKRIRKEKENEAAARKAKAIVITGDDEDNDAVTTTKTITINSDDDDNVVVGSGNTQVKSKTMVLNNNRGPIVVTSSGTTPSNSYEKMLDYMERDGLVDRSEDYKIEKYSDVLYINGNEQPQKVFDKYVRYLTGKKVIIKGGPNRLKITVKD